MNFNSQFMVRNFWAHIPRSMLCPRHVLLPPGKPALGVFYLGIFYTFIIFGMEHSGLEQGLHFHFDHLGINLYFGGFYQNARRLVESGKREWKLTSFSIIVFNVHEMCETWQTWSHSKWIIATNKIISSRGPLFSNQVVHNPDIPVCFLKCCCSPRSQHLKINLCIFI